MNKRNFKDALTMLPLLFWLFGSVQMFRPINTAEGDLLISLIIISLCAYALFMSFYILALKYYKISDAESYEKHKKDCLIYMAIGTFGILLFAFFKIVLAAHGLKYFM